MSIYKLEAKLISGEKINLQKYQGKKLIIVNTASKCGFTAQYEDLQALYEKYHEQGLEILGFPCDQFKNQEPDSNEDIEQFCKINFGVTFPLFEKVEVKGENIHPIFEYLIKAAPYTADKDDQERAKPFREKFTKYNPDGMDDDSIKWNFTKFLIDQEGNVVKRFEPYVAPMEIEEYLKL